MFPKTIHSVKGKQKTLIMFLEYYPKYQDSNFIMIWFKFAHQMFLQKKKVYIDEFTFQYPKRNNFIPMTMPFSHKITQYTISQKEEDDEEILSLCQQINQIKM